MESRTGRKSVSGLHRCSSTSSGEVLDITRPKSPPSSPLDHSVTAQVEHSIFTPPCQRPEDTDGSADLQVSRVLIGVLIGPESTVSPARSCSGVLRRGAGVARRKHEANAVELCSYRCTPDVLIIRTQPLACGYFEFPLKGQGASAFDRFE
jgi:hypothetical protein